jgi:hypothetical protein
LDNVVQKKNIFPALKFGDDLHAFQF